MSGSNSKVIPREELSAFQRWQFNSLLDAPEEESAPQQTPASAHVAPETEQETSESVAADIDADTQVVEEVLAYPTAEEIQAIEQQAQDDGYQAGFAAGKQAAEADIERLRALLGDLADTCMAAENALADDVVDLALVVAKQMIREALRVDRSLLMPAIREAIAGLPLVKESARIFFHPDDLAALSSLLAGELSSDYWRFLPDPALPCGSCRIETSNSSVNLLLAERWANILQVLGRDNREDLAWSEESPPVADTEK